ncbi:hypothetical protein [Streptomyces xanthophaeus]|uniref:hypothetical protein n=1 Tax=Streptomyces xanthophaeus TaxID=67385 RepID=UPI0037106672
MEEVLWPGVGGIRGLRELIRRHGRALEADLRSEYGVRLSDLYTGRLTWRELLSYVEGLPPTSRLRTALNGGRPEPSAEAVLLADIFDMLQNVDWHIVASNVDKKSNLPKTPKPYPRWWMKPSRPKADGGERVARLEAARARRRARADDIAAGRIA